MVALHLQEGDRLSRTFSYPTFVQYHEQAGQVFEVVAGSGLRAFRVSVGNDTRLAQAAFVTEGCITRGPDDRATRGVVVLRAG